MPVDKKETLDKTLKFRLSASEFEEIKLLSKAAGKPISAYLRLCALNKNFHSSIPSRVVSTVDSQAAFEIRKIGALIKSRYPKDDKSWTNEEKRQYWMALNELLAISRTLEGDKDVS